MWRLRLSLAAFASTGLAAGTLLAGPEQVAFPEGYRSDYIHYLDVDHYGRKSIRKMFVSPGAAARAEPGEELPDGTVLIAEEVRAKVDADGNLVRDDEGRLIALDVIDTIIVMQKNAAISTENGNWDYAVFGADGKLTPGVDYKPCFECHESRADRDFNFTYSKFLLDQNK